MLVACTLTCECVLYNSNVAAICSPWVQIRLIGHRTQNHVRNEWIVERQPPIWLIPCATAWCGQMHHVITAATCSHTRVHVLTTMKMMMLVLLSETTRVGSEAFCLQVSGAATSQVV